MSKEHSARPSCLGTGCTSEFHSTYGKRLRREALRFCLSILLHTAAWILLRASTETFTWRSRPCCTESMKAKRSPQTTQRRSSWLCAPWPALATSCFRSIDSSSVNESRMLVPRIRQYWPRVFLLSRSGAFYAHIGAEELCSSQSCQRVRLAWCDGNWSGTSSSRLWRQLEEVPLFLCACSLQARPTWHSRRSAELYSLNELYKWCLPLQLPFAIQTISSWGKGPCSSLSPWLNRKRPVPWRRTISQLRHSFLSLMQQASQASSASLSQVRGGFCVSEKGDRGCK